MIVKINSQDTDYSDLSKGHLYFVIGIEADDYRIINDHGKPYLYPSDLFAVIDAAEPSDWITEYGDEGERYSYPSKLNEVGFFEDYFDGKNEAVSEFWHEVNQRLSRAA